MVRNVSITASSVTIQWTVTGTSNADKFVVFYGTTSGKLNLNISVDATSDRHNYSTRLDSLAGGTMYYYRVEARNEFAPLSSIEMSFITDTTPTTEMMTLITDDASKFCMVN